jgi:dTDP-4-amino-4,6-dideoxygalactose transaminase
MALDQALNGAALGLVQELVSASATFEYAATDSRRESIPFNRACLTGHELTYITQAVENGHIAGDGQFTKLCQSLLEQELGVAKALLTTSCTHALEMAALLLDIQPGDEVIVPSFTFVSTINAFVLRGAQPVFIDVRMDTLNIDENRLEALITPRTRAILVVHYAGVGCEMDRIMAIARKYDIAVVEDNAHGLFGKYKGQYLGTFGALATQSFHETKNFTCGEGGALLIQDVRLVERAEILREKGTNRSRFFRGQIDKYTWVDVGSSYLPSDILGAFLYAQLEDRVRIQRIRQRIWHYYYAHLAEWALDNRIGLPEVPVHCEQSYHMFYLLLPTLEQRQAFIAHLKAHGVMSVFHYVPLHLSEMGLRLGGRAGDCPVTENISDRLVRLPFYNSLDEVDQDRVMDAIKSFDLDGATTIPGSRRAS